MDILGYAAADAVQQSIYDACRSADAVEFAGAWEGVVPKAQV